MTSGPWKAFLYRIAGMFWMWAAAACGFAQSQAAHDDTLLQEFADLEIQGYANPRKAQARLLEILDRLDSQTMRRAWLRGFTFLEAEHRDKRFQGNYDSLVKEALALKDLHSYVRLLWIQARGIQQKAPRSQVAALYELAARAACDDLRDAILCGGTRMQENEYYF
ncbi:MAG: hypothetical protein M3Q07_18890, partial [Pseudobdellovibrionaceae bacterium]|nr:hypothetical protein [Pseudobdellovibrionaceae bacterium]